MAFDVASKSASFLVSQKTIARPCAPLYTCSVLTITDVRVRGGQAIARCYQPTDQPTSIFHQWHNMQYNFSSWKRVTHTHTHVRLTALCPGLPGWAGTRNVKPIWILLEQETVSGSGISWALCKSAPRSRQITTPAPHHSVFYKPDALPTNSERQSTEGQRVRSQINHTPETGKQTDKTNSSPQHKLHS